MNLTRKGQFLYPQDFTVHESFWGPSQNSQNEFLSNAVQFYLKLIPKHSTRFHQLIVVSMYSLLWCWACASECLSMVKLSSTLLGLQNNMANLAADFSAIKELDSLSNEIVDLQR